MAQLAIQIRAFVHAKLFRRRRIVNRAPVGEQAVLQRGVVAGLAGDRQSPAQPGGGETDERQSPLPVKYFVRREQMAVRRQPALGNGCINLCLRLPAPAPLCRDAIPLVAPEFFSTTMRNDCNFPFSRSAESSQRFSSRWQMVSSAVADSGVG